MIVEFQDPGGETFSVLAVPGLKIKVERDGAGKIVRVGTVLKLTHTSPGGKSYEYTGGIWVERGDFQNADNSLKTKVQISAGLKAKYDALVAAKRAEWDGLDSAVPEVLA